MSINKSNLTLAPRKPVVPFKPGDTGVITRNPDGTIVCGGGNQLTPFNPGNTGVITRNPDGTIVCGGLNQKA